MLARPGLHGIPALTHAFAPASSAGRERDRHAAFLADNLLLAFAALATAPLFLAARGAPTPAESLLFAAMLTPGAAALVVARTGRLAVGQAVAATGLAAIGLTLFLGLGAGAGAAIAWLAAAALDIVALDVAHPLDRHLRRLGWLAGGGAILGAVTAAFAPRFAPTLPPGAVAVLTGLAMPVAGLALRRLHAATRDLEIAAAARAARAEAIDAAQDRVILDLDGDGSVRALSRPAPGFLAGPDDAHLGRGLFDHVHVADRPAFLKLVDDAAHGDATMVGRFRLRVADGAAEGGRHLALEMRARRLVPGGAVVAVVEDVSDRFSQADELETSRRAVAEALRAKDQFMTTMSHELRTPLNAIIGFSEMLASRTMRPEDIAKQCEYARIIHQSGRHLLHVVNAVLDVSRLQSGTYPIQPEAFDATALLDQAIEAVAGQAREGAVRLRHDHPEALEEIVGDKRALKAALVALLSNAVKFTAANGEVAMSARPEGTALVVTVADSGCGIAAEHLGRLGQPFFQAGGSLARSHDGAGLGLTLVRGLVGLHGGRLSIESEAGLGTTVTLRLPLDCRVIARRTADLEIDTARRRPPPRLLMSAKDAA